MGSDVARWPYYRRDIARPDEMQPDEGGGGIRKRPTHLRMKAGDIIKETHREIWTLVSIENGWRTIVVVDKITGGSYTLRRKVLE
jgi:hypothetical protein